LARLLKTTRINLNLKEKSESTQVMLKLSNNQIKRLSSLSMLEHLEPKTMSWLVSKVRIPNNRMMFLINIRLHLGGLVKQAFKMIGIGNQVMMQHATLEFHSEALVFLRNKKSTQ
jgi:hypothetical protein